MAVMLCRAACPMLPLAPSPRGGQVQPRPSRGSSRGRGGVQQMMPASGSPGRPGVWPRYNARIRSRFRASGTPSCPIRAPRGTGVESRGCAYIWIPSAGWPATYPTTTATPTSRPPTSRPNHPTPTSPWCNGAVDAHPSPLTMPSTSPMTSRVVPPAEWTVCRWRCSTRPSTSTRIRSRRRSLPCSRPSPRASSWPTRLASGRGSRRESCSASSGRNASAVCW